MEAAFVVDLDSPRYVISRLCPAPVLADRIWRRIEVLPDGCWRWTGARSGAGYAQVRWDGRSQSVHRLVCGWVEGELGELHVDHLCRRRECVNPDHLDPVTKLENDRRGADARAKPECPNGHPNIPENRIKSPAGGTRCKFCHRDRERMRRRRRKQGQA